jgi:hypothetical protein
MPKTASFPLALAAALSLALSGCGDDKKSGTQSPSASSTPITTSTPTVQPTTGTGPVKRTAAELTKALLELKDLPTGFTLEPDDPATRGVKPFSSKDAKCRTLVKYLNADEAPGAKASAHRSFAGGQEGPYIDFSLDAMGDSKTVLALQASYKAAVNACKKLTLKIAGQGMSPMGVREISAPQYGDQPFAFRLTGLSGPLEGREFAAATAGVNDVIVSVSVLAGQPGDLNGATEVAVGKATDVLKSKTGS